MTSASGAGLDDLFPTVQQVLELSSVSQGVPSVLAGHDGLNSRVQWVHVCEQPDMADFINGGELVLTSGAGLQRSADAWIPMVDEISDCGAVGLVIELGRYFDSVPDGMVSRANSRQLPLVTLERSTRFVDVTHSVHKMIKDAQFAELQRRMLVHETFTHLTVSGADAEAVVDEVGAILGCSVVLENVAHQVLACHARDHAVTCLLTGWEYRSRSIGSDARIAYDDESQWLLTQVGANGEIWGRLIILLAGQPSTTARDVAERAADALALRRLIERDRETLEHRSQRSLLNAILNNSYADTSEIVARARALGLELMDQQLIGGRMQVRAAGQPPTIPRSAEAQYREYTASVERALHGSAGISGLVASAGANQSVLVLSVPRDADVEAHLRQFAPAVHEQLRHLPWPCDATLGFGLTVESIGDVARSCEEAGHVIAAAAGSGRRKPYYRLEDVHVQGLLYLLREDVRVQAFVERELGPLLKYDERHGSDLVNVLRMFLEQGGNKSKASRELHLSRPALYERLTRIEHIMGVDLAASEAALSLHIALRALDCMRGDGA